MSGYKVEEFEGESYFVDSNGNTRDDYWLFYSDKQRKRMKSVLRQFDSVWFDVYNTLMVYRQYEIDTNPLMERISKIFLMTLRASKTQSNDLLQRKKSNKEYRKRLNKLKNKINPV